MSRSSQETLRHVPSADCTRCGTPVDPDQGMFVLREETAVDEGDTVESGNLCADCFGDARTFLHGES